MAKRVKIVGQRGRWVAEVEGKLLPVLHHTMRIGANGYFGPFPTDPRRSKKYQELEAALHSNELAVVQRDKDPVKLDRDGYVGVFRFSDLKIDYASGFSLKLVERYADPA